MVAARRRRLAFRHQFGDGLWISAHTGDGFFIRRAGTVSPLQAHQFAAEGLRVEGPKIVRTLSDADGVDG